MQVITCLTTEHNLFIVGLAALFCLFGSGVTVSLFTRMQAATASIRTLRLLLSGVSAGATTWCTHFVAMLAYDPRVEIAYEPAQTALSLVAAIMGSCVGLWLASRERSMANVAMGGIVLGLSMAIMHYLGMSAYIVDGLLKWRYPYILLSVTLAMLFATAALASVRYLGRMLAVPFGAGLFAMAILGLHFVGMAALKISAAGGAVFPASSGETVLAITAAGIGIMVIGIALAAHFIDIQGDREAMERMRQLAMSDILTDLPNRAHFGEHLKQALVSTEETGQRLAVLVIDLDRFKDINDLRGHAAGDRALQIVAERMSAVLREDEFLARLGGDEFAAVKIIEDHDGAADFARRLHEAICQSIQVGDGIDTVIEASVGVAIYPQDGDTDEGILGNADLAMYRAKASDYESICFYSQEMDETVRQRRKVVSDLRVALSENQFEVHYQVQTSLSNNGTVGYEALLRWRHPERGLIQADQFIPTAEETGLILPIGEWIMRKACEEAAGWKLPHKVTVNLSAVQFAHSDLPGMVERILSETGLPPERLELELTESTLMAEPERNVETLRQIQELGVSLALDDFGTGYSSFATLRNFQFNRLKLDRSFVENLEDSVQAKAIVRAIIAMADGLGIPVVAEGVETEGQLAFLIYEGCNEAQGYLIGRPAPIEEIAEVAESEAA